MTKFKILKTLKMSEEILASQINFGRVKIPFFLKHFNAKRPENNDIGGNAGYDFYGAERYVEPDGTVVINTGVCVAIPRGFVGFLMMRSSNNKKQSILGNAVGVIDPNYRGEVIAKFKHTQNPINIFPTQEFSDLELGSGLNKQNQNSFFRAGEKCVQMVVIRAEEVDWEEVHSLEALGTTERGDKGFGEYSGS